MQRKEMNTINVTLITRNNCTACDEVLKKLRLLQRSYYKILIHVYNIDEIRKEEIKILKNKAIITPAMFVNERLKLYGNETSEKIKSLIIN